MTDEKRKLQLESVLKNLPYLQHAEVSDDAHSKLISYSLGTTSFSITEDQTLLCFVDTDEATFAAFSVELDSPRFDHHLNRFKSVTDAAVKQHTFKVKEHRMRKTATQSKENEIEM